MATKTAVMNEETHFSESKSKAILDMLVLNSAKLSCIREELGVLFVHLFPSITPESHSATQSQRLTHHYQRLKELVWEHYGEFDLDNLLNTPPFDPKE